MATRTLEHIEHSEGNAAILVTGGFHTPTLTRVFRSREVPYVVIAPVIKAATEPGVWDRITRQQIKEKAQEEGG